MNNAGGKATTFNEREAAAALKRLASLHQLNVEASLARGRDAFVFHILNKSVGLAHYDRAVLWKWGRRPSLAGISGQTTLHPRSEMAALWRRLLPFLQPLETPLVLDARNLPPDALEDWEALRAMVPGLQALWIPLRAGGRSLGGLWLERWNNKAWGETDVRLFSSLGLGYAANWDKFFSASRPSHFKQLFSSRLLLLLLLVALACALVLVRAPLRIVAPCEVVPKDPYVVTAPLEGVIASLDVRPNQAVDKGALLFSYDKRVPLEQLNLARQQTKVIGSTLERSRLQAFENPTARAETAILSLKLEQERIRQHMAEQNAALLEVRAEAQGRVVVDDPDEWRGRPVVVGEKVMEIVDPGRTMLRIWLPQDDNVVFSNRPLKVMLNAFPERSLEAELSFVDREVSVSPRGEARIKAEARWLSSPERIKMGLMGVAVIYGDTVPLGYWLLRKPLFWLRGALGI